MVVSSDEGNPRSVGALDQLIKIVQRVISGELVIGDFYINASVSDPCRMNIELKVVRGPQAADSERSTDIDTRRAPVQLKGRNYDYRDGYWRDELGNLLPMSKSLSLPPPPPRSSKSKPEPKKLVHGARDLDLED